MDSKRANIEGAALSKWRDLAVEDMPALEEIAESQGRLVGHKTTLLNPAQFPALAPRVLEHDGEVIGLVVFVAEMEVFATNPRFVAEMMKRVDELKEECRSVGIERVLCDVEPVTAGALGPRLESAGFTELPPTYKRYFLYLGKESVKRA